MSLQSKVPISHTYILDRCQLSAGTSQSLEENQRNATQAQGEHASYFANTGPDWDLIQGSPVLQDRITNYCTTRLHLACGIVDCDREIREGIMSGKNFKQLSFGWIKHEVVV